MMDLEGAEGRDQVTDAGSAQVEALWLQVLGERPAPAIPDGFAARVTAAALRQPLPRPSVWQGFGVRIALVSGVALTVGMFAFAPHAAPSFRSLNFDVQLLLLGELGAVAYVVARLGLPE